MFLPANFLPGADLGVVELLGEVGRGDRLNAQGFRYCWVSDLDALLDGLCLHICLPDFCNKSKLGNGLM